MDAANMLLEHCASVLGKDAQLQVVALQGLEAWVSRRSSSFALLSFLPGMVPIVYCTAHSSFLVSLGANHGSGKSRGKV